MQTVLVVGLGEIGGTIFTVLKDSQKFKIYGVDVDKKKMSEYNTVEPPSQSPTNELNIYNLHTCTK